MDYIDTRDLNTRLEELEDMISQMEDIKDELVVSVDNGDIESLKEDYRSIQNEFDEDEHATLCEMRDEIPEWRDGNTLIPDDQWVDYVIDMLKDCGDLPQDIPWYIEIDEQKTADNIQIDYSYIDYNNEIYWFRNC